MKKSLLIFGCLLVVSIHADFEVIPSTKWDNFYGDVCEVTEGPGEKFMDHVNYLGIAAGLVVLLPLLPEVVIAAEAATFLATTLGGIYGIAAALGGGSPDQPDYSQQARDCFKSWVSGEIDEALLSEAKAAMELAGIAYQDMGERLNDTAIDAETALVLAKTYYERIRGYRDTVEELYRGQRRADAPQRAESMLHFFLDLLGMQSHAGLTIMSYALLNAPQDLEIFRLLYVTDVEDILNREFNEEDQEVGIRLIFDNSRMAKEWKRDLAIEFGHDCAACFHDDSFCHIRDPYRNLQKVNECKAPCHFSDGCARHCHCDNELKEVQEYVDKELKAVHDDIDAAKSVQEGYRTRMLNMKIE